MNYVRYYHNYVKMSTKIIIAGGRDYEDYEELEDCVSSIVESLPGKLEIVCGMAKGADQLGKQFADEYHIPAKIFPADWYQHGRAAGPIRNRQMAKYADILIAFWDGKSKGTNGMIHDALHEGLEVHVFRYTK